MYEWQRELTEAEKAFEAVVWAVAKAKRWDGAMAYGAKWERKQAERKARQLFQAVGCDYETALQVAGLF